MLAMMFKNKRTVDRLAITPTDDLAILAVWSVVLGPSEDFERMNRISSVARVVRRIAGKQSILAKVETKQKESLEMWRKELNEGEKENANRQTHVEVGWNI
jgi:hypothetical protein